MESRWSSENQVQRVAMKKVAAMKAHVLMSDSGMKALRMIPPRFPVSMPHLLPQLLMNPKS
jgi:hypothetical protein